VTGLEVWQTSRSVSDGREFRVWVRPRGERPVPVGSVALAADGRVLAESWCDPADGVVFAVFDGGDVGAAQSWLVNRLGTSRRVW